MGLIDQVLAALAPFAVIIVVGILLVLLAAEARGAMHRAGTTARRSSPGIAALIAVVLALALFSIVEGSELLGGLLLAAIIVAVAAWVVSAAGHRGARAA